MYDHRRADKQNVIGPIAVVPRCCYNGYLIHQFSAGCCLRSFRTLNSVVAKVVFSLGLHDPFGVLFGVVIFVKFT